MLKDIPMNKLIFQTNDSWAPTIMRIFLGVVVFAHGAQKLLGWFGGYGFNGTMEYFTETVALPWLVGFLIIMLESLGALALMLGLGTRVLAISLSFLAIGIIFTTHVQYGFFMNWFNSQGGEGYEYFLLWLGISIGLVFTGGGKYALDSLFVKNKTEELVTT